MKMGLWLMLSLGVMLTGCGIEPALSGKAREDYLKSIKPYIEYWEKDGMTPEVRGQDSADCGGGRSLTHAPQFGQKELDAARLPSEKEHETYRRLHHDWQRCMLKKGYRYTGKCYDTEVGRASPACAGRALQPLK